MLVRSLYLSVDPYMRGRISPSKNYTTGVVPGQLMCGGGVGEVVRSNVPGFEPGEVVESFGFGWQDYAVLPATGTRKVDPALAPVHSALSYLGLPGLTAYFALLDIGRPRPGDTVVVSAASGAVGQIVGQLAKLAGCRAVAVASSDKKLAWCRELGYDAGVNYRNGEDLTAAIGEVCPGGIDVFFDNTAGPIHDAVMHNLATGARIIICGTVALAERFGQPDIGPRFLRQILVARARVEGFLLFDYAHRHEEGLARLAAWSREGRLRHREDILDGLERMPEAFLRLLRSENFGKQLVRVAPDAV
jgi:NADPH-dependent curcumin reductase CurA